MHLGLDSGSVIKRIWAQFGPEHRTGSSHFPVTPAPGDPSKPPAFLGMFTHHIHTDIHIKKKYLLKTFKFRHLITVG